MDVLDQKHLFEWRGEASITKRGKVWQYVIFYYDSGRQTQDTTNQASLSKEATAEARLTEADLIHGYDLQRQRNLDGIFSVGYETTRMPYITERTNITIGTR